MAREGAGRKGRQPRRYDFASFRGYRGPRFTPIPDEFLDHQLADLTSAETKVMLFLFRKTYGYRKSADRVSFAQLERGTVSSEGTIIDRGTGLSKATIWRALKGLQQKGLIEVWRQTTEAGDSDVNYYHIRELRSPDAEEDDSGSLSSNPPPSRSPKRPSRPPVAPSGGSFSSETTPVSKLNHRDFRTERPGGFIAKPTREDSTREDSTLSATDPLSPVALRFLRGIGYPRPAKAKRERTLGILRQLLNDEAYSIEEIAAACDIAVSLGARGPELIPHVIGQSVETGTEAGERFAKSQEQERKRWRDLTAEFEALPGIQREALLKQAQASHPILAERSLDHPIVRAAAIGLLGGRG